MELWIRSQDRIVLMKIDTLSLAIDEEGTILGYGTDGSIKVNLANYKTKERAWEVLEEIQEQIKKQELTMFFPDKIEKVKYYGKVYEMPKE